MSEQGEELLQRLLSLNRGEVFEAVLALGDLLDVEQASGAQAERFASEIQEQPFEALDDVEQLARAALIAVAFDPRHSAEALSVADRVGEKAFIFGGAEVVAAGVIAAGIIQTVLAKGRTSEEETIEIVLDDQGRRHITHRRKTVYGLSARVGQLLSSILPHSGGG